MAFELKPEQVTDYLQEIKTSQRIVELDGEVLVFKNPTVEDNQQARVVQVQVLNTLLNQGVPSKMDLRKQLVNRLKENGKDPELLEKRNEIYQRVAEKMQNMDEAVAPEAITNPAHFVQFVKDSLTDLTPQEMQMLEQFTDVDQLESELMANSAEAIADAEKQLFLMHRCIFTAKGERYWNEYDDIRAYDNSSLINSITEEFQRFLMGLPMVFEMKLPEPKTPEDSELKKSQAP